MRVILCKTRPFSCQQLAALMDKTGNKYGGLLGPSKVPLFFYFDSYMIDTYKCQSTLITVDRQYRAYKCRSTLITVET